jgi:uncharacterized membrane protein
MSTEIWIVVAENKTDRRDNTVVSAFTTQAAAVAYEHKVSIRYPAYQVWWTWTKVDVEEFNYDGEDDE